jgi:hypothetical protein
LEEAGLDVGISGEVSVAVAGLPSESDATHCFVRFRVY